MENVKVIQYEPIHGYTIAERNTRESNVWLSRYPDWEKAIEGWKKAGPAFTLMVDDEPVACAGVVLLYWQRGEAWMLGSSLVRKYRLSIFRNIKTYLELIVRENKLRRLQALCGLDSPEGISLLKHLGFKNETPNGLEAFGPNGETLLMFAKIYKVNSEGL